MLGQHFAQISLRAMGSDFYSVLLFCISYTALEKEFILLASEAHSYVTIKNSQLFI